MTFEPVARRVDGYYIAAALPRSPEGVEAASLVKTGRTVLR